MENQNERVLAYTLAKQISHEELSDVSGGKASGWQMTQYLTGGASGGGGSWDTRLDITVDW
ncbi:MAG: hypothetical protein Q8M03_03065 [Legionella sp.]|nr:hypothetical protein [Legionella sp.]